MRKRGQAVTQMLYHISLANQEQLAFSLWSHKWKASVTVETKPGGSDCLTATCSEKKNQKRKGPLMNLLCDHTTVCHGIKT